MGKFRYIFLLYAVMTFHLKSHAAQSEIYPAGFVLTQGQSKTVGQAMLVMQSDCNLVVYKQGVAVWNAGISINPATHDLGNTSANQCKVTLQTDTNLSITNDKYPVATPGGKWYLWGSTNRAESATSQLIFSDEEPYLTITSVDTGSIFWSTTNIFKNLILTQNNKVRVGNIDLVMQSDCNLVVYKIDPTQLPQIAKTPVWNSRTANTATNNNCRAVFNDGGGLLVMNNDTSVWRSENSTTERPGSKLQIADTPPYLKILAADNTILWTDLFSSTSDLVDSATTDSTKDQKLSELSLFRRCYAQLTGRPVPLKHPSYLALKNKSVGGLTACQNLVDMVKLDPQSGLLTNPNSQDAQAILNQLHAFHRTWFSANTVEQIQGFGTEIGMGTIDLYDSTEPSLALTKSVFTDRANFSDVVTAPTGVQAVREDDQKIRSRRGGGFKNPGRRYRNDIQSENNIIEFRGTANGDYDAARNSINTFLVPFPYIQAGDLRGIRSTTASVQVPNFSYRPLSGDPGTDSAHHVPDLNYSFDLYKTLGGGVLGTPIYLMMNYGRELGTPSNGTTRLPRRWSQANLNSFLCATLPALRESDIRNLVVNTSDTPFRKASSCVSCHATLDPMAYTARNVVIGGSNYNQTNDPANFTKATLLMSTFKQKSPSVAGWPDIPVEGFHTQTPTGRLFFRSATGKLVDRNLNSIADLGTAISETEDYYMCAAKRYYAFFTGKEISLYDRTNPANAELNKALTKSAIKDRLFIENLAKNLKNDQSIKNMIKAIFSSDEYAKKDFGL